MPSRQPYMAEPTLLVFCSRRRASLFEIPQSRGPSCKRSAPGACGQLRHRDRPGTALFGELYSLQQHGYGLHCPSLRLLLDPSHLPFNQRPQQYSSWSVLDGPLWIPRQHCITALDVLYHRHVLVSAGQAGHWRKSVVPSRLCPSKA